MHRIITNVVRMDAPKSPKAFASAKQVAALAGVSRSAVSRAFTPGASISDEKRRRILLAAEQLGYHVNHLARGLLGGQSGIVCLAVAESDTPYLSRVLRTLIECIQQSGRVAMVLATSGPAEHVEEALRQTLNYRADATVVLSGTPSQSIIRTCLDNGQRLILIIATTIWQAPATFRSTMPPPRGPPSTPSCVRAAGVWRS